ncbi:VIT domain-containing protein [Acrocarpospora catenulata]|uniref:VIT domain-containing protein n=1 Tax=Acrocarpospora catenulata TaxID=2836182 RepID=UPI001BDA3CA8|nr:VIT domain-containing protein [Acrocarpospora catenulata]
MTVPITPLRPEACVPVTGAGLGALETEKGNLPLESVEVTATISGLTAGVLVAQGFRNPYEVALEATYVFPLPPRAAVTEFTMEADGHVVEGLLKERGEARADYDRALAEGRRAAIAEEDRPDVFAIRVGNIVPGERVTVRLALSQPLPYEDGSAEFRFPLVVAPRYIPGAPLDGAPSGSGVAPDTDAVPDASRITPPVLLPGFPSPVRLALTTVIDPAGLALREIQSSLHTVDTAEGETVTVSLRPGERLDRDFILRFGFDASTSLALAPDEEGTEGTFALTVMPPADVTALPAPRDVVLLLDRSGSMGGWKMVAARRAAARIVDTLTSRDRFAVLSFDHVVELAFPGEGLVAATDRNRFRAVEHLARLNDRGGTEILAPMEMALDLLADRERDRVMVLVTDGQVGNEDEIVERVGARVDGIRVHAVGIDRAVNAGFLGRLALLGSGRCELVESEDRLDEAMEHIHRRIGSPLVTDLTLAGLDLDLAEETVSHVGSFYPGVPLQVWGRYRGTGAEPAIAVRGTSAEGKPWEQTIAGRTVQAPSIRAVWARGELRRLEDRYTIGARQLEPEIVRVSLRYGVLCRFTSFVAVDSRVVADGRPEHHVIQPVEQPSGWEPMSPVAAGAAPAAAPMMMRAAFAAADEGFGEAALPPSAPPPAPAAAPKPRPAGRPGAPFAAQAFPGQAFPAPMSPPPPPVAQPAAESAGPGSRKRSGDVLLPHPGREQAVRPPLNGARALLVEELARLRAAGTRPDPERRRYLSDLASRLKVLAQMASNHPDLLTLASELQWAERPDFDLPRLWQHTLDVLTRLTEDTTPTPVAPPSRTRRPFWKR